MVPETSTMYADLAHGLAALRIAQSCLLFVAVSTETKQRKYVSPSVRISERSVWMKVGNRCMNGTCKPLAHRGRPLVREGTQGADVEAVR